MIFRNAQLTDLSRIVAIYNSTIPGRMVTADVEPISVESRMQWFQEHTPHKRPLWVVENEENIIIGWISFQSFYGRPAYDATVEISIYLDEKLRGKGVGSQMLAYSLSRADEFNIENIVGFIFAHNEPSLKLFKKFGFEEWAHLPEVAQLDGIKRSIKIVGKKIN